MYIYLYVYWRIFFQKELFMGGLFTKKIFSWGKLWEGENLRGEVVEHGELMIKSCQERGSAL